MEENLTCARCAVACARSSFSKSQLRKKADRKCKPCVQAALVEDGEARGEDKQKNAGVPGKSDVHDGKPAKKDTKLAHDAKGEEDGGGSPIAVSQTQDFDSDSSLSAAETGAKRIAKKETAATSAGKEAASTETLKMEAALRERYTRELCAFFGASLKIKRMLKECSLDELKGLVDSTKTSASKSAKGGHEKEEKDPVSEPTPPSAEKVALEEAAKPRLKKSELVPRAKELLQRLFPGKNTKKILMEHKGKYRGLIKRLEEALAEIEEAEAEEAAAATHKTGKKRPREETNDSEAESDAEPPKLSKKKAKKKAEGKADEARGGKPGPVVCDKCDGEHETQRCPHYKKSREKHPDAQRRKAIAGLGGAGGNMFVLAKDARVYPQPGDGSCLYHSMFRGLRGEGPSSTHALRQALANWVRNNAHVKIADTPVNEWVRWDAQCSVETYCRRMRSHAWGGGIEMAAFSRLYEIQVDVYERSRGGYKRISCFLAPRKPKRCISVLYCGGIHYDAIEIHGAKQKLPPSLEAGGSRGPKRILHKKSASFKLASMSGGRGLMGHSYVSRHDRNHMKKTHMRGRRNRW